MVNSNWRHHDRIHHINTTWAPFLECSIVAFTIGTRGFCTVLIYFYDYCCEYMSKLKPRANFVEWRSQLVHSAVSAIECIRKWQILLKIHDLPLFYPTLISTYTIFFQEKCLPRSLLGTAFYCNPLFLAYPLRCSRLINLVLFWMRNSLEL